MTRTSCGNWPEWQLWNFVRYLYLDWAPTREWLLNEKVASRNRDDMEHFLNKFKRKRLCLYDQVRKQIAFNVLPWELTIPGEQQGNSNGHAPGETRTSEESEEKIPSASSALVEELARDFGLPIL